MFFQNPTLKCSNTIPSDPVIVPVASMHDFPWAKTAHSYLTLSELSYNYYWNYVTTIIRTLLQLLLELCYNYYWNSVTTIIGTILQLLMDLCYNYY